MAHIDEQRFNTLKEVYVRGLTKAAEENKDNQYAMLQPNHPRYLSPAIVADRMFDTIKNKGLGHSSITNSRGWTLACRELGINCTYKAVGAYLAGS